MMNILYPFSRYPHLNTTFILDEVLEVQSLGHSVTIAELLQPQYGYADVHERHGEFRGCLISRARRWRLPLAVVRGVLSWPRQSLSVLFSLTRASVRNPFALAKALYGWSLGLWIALHCRESRIDWVHCHFASLPATAGWTAAAVLGIPYSITGQGFDVFATSRSIRNDALAAKVEAASFFVATSQYMADHVDGLCDGRSAHKTYVIPNGIRIDALQAQAQVGSRSPRHSGALVVSLGSYVPKKGHDTTIRAVSALVGVGVDLSLIVVGPGDRRPYEDLVRRLGLPDGRVELMGPLPHESVIPMLAKADVFALPCRVSHTGDRDGTPSVLKEAIALGVPVVSTAVSGIPELVRDGESGSIVPPDDEVALSEAIASIIRDPARATGLSNGAIRLLRADHDVRRNAARLLGIMQRQLDPA